VDGDESGDRLALQRREIAPQQPRTRAVCVENGAVNVSHEQAGRCEVEELTLTANALLELIPQIRECFGALEQLFLRHLQLLERRQENRRQLRLAWRHLRRVWRHRVRAEDVRGVLEQNLPLLGEGSDEIVGADEVLFHNLDCGRVYGGAPYCLERCALLRSL